MTARFAEADDANLQEEVTAWMAENGLEEIMLDAEQWRAIVMGSAVAADLASQAVGELLPAEGTPPPMLQLMPMLPSRGIWTSAAWPACGCAT